MTEHCLVTDELFVINELQHPLG